MNTRKHNAETQNKKITSALEWGQKIETMYLHVLGVSVLRLPLGMF